MRQTFLTVLPSRGFIPRQQGGSACRESPETPGTLVATCLNRTAYPSVSPNTTLVSEAGLVPSGQTAVKGEVLSLPRSYHKLPLWWRRLKTASKRVWSRPPSTHWGKACEGPEWPGDFSPKCPEVAFCSLCSGQFAQSPWGRTGPAACCREGVVCAVEMTPDGPWCHPRAVRWPSSTLSWLCCLLQ